MILNFDSILATCVRPQLSIDKSILKINKIRTKFKYTQFQSKCEADFHWPVPQTADLIKCDRIGHVFVAVCY